MQADNTRPPWQPTFRIDTATPIATAGTGFAQLVTTALNRQGGRLLDLEPPPPGLVGDSARRFGFLQGSARFGAIETPRQLAQLVSEAFGGEPYADCVDRDGERYRDAFRPAVEPLGLASAEHVLAHRRQHLARVRALVRQAALLVFTVGKPEAWISRETRHVFPQAPATAKRKTHVQRSFPPEAIAHQLAALRDVLQKHNPALRMLLTVEAPDPGLHEAVRRFALSHPDTDYLPGHDAKAMLGLFFASLVPAPPAPAAGGEPDAGKQRRPRKRGTRHDDDEIVCEEVLLDAFAR